MSDLRLILAAALGLSTTAAAQLPATEIPEASEETAVPEPTPVTASAPNGCTEALGAARCDTSQLIGADVAIILAHAAWATPVEKVRTNAILAVPVTIRENTKHLVYRVTRHEGAKRLFASVDAETGVVLESGASYITRGRPLMSETGPVRGRLRGDASQEPLAQAWAEAALDEAASVVAFEVHAEELRRVGAPGSLVERAQIAADDERRHAAAAFALASRFAGREVLADGLPPPTAPRSDLFAVARGVLLEGCLNETLALAEAREALMRCIDREVHSALIEVVREETQHAELAFETLRWLLPRLSAIERDQLLQEVLAYQPATSALDVPDGFGMLSGAVANDLRLRTLREVLQPLLLTAIGVGAG